VITLPGHKDDHVAKPLAERLAARFGRAVVVIVGIHVDKATQAEIAEMVANAESCGDAIIQRIGR
jgi:translation initiation factor 1 (eIF-1/SUI1)